MRTSFFIALGILCLTGTSVLGQSSYQLTTLNERAKSADGHSVSYVQVNDEVFEDPSFGVGSTVEIHAPEGVAESFRILSIREFVSGYHSLIARHATRPDELMSVTIHDGAMFGLWHRQNTGNVYMGLDKPTGRTYATDHAENRGDILACGVGAHSNDGSDDLVARSKGISEAASYMMNEAMDDSITIDLMLVYTNAAAAWATSESGFGDINGVVAQAMNLSQAALINSELEIELRLVNLTLVDYDETTDGLESEDSPSGVRLSRFTETNDGFMDNIHSIRDQSGADIVAWILFIDDTGGLGWRLGNAGGDPRFGFNLNRVQQVADGYTLIHEIGHNMGNAHSRTQADAEATEGGGLFHYSVGYQNTIGGFHTVMAYPDGLAEAPLFSSPDLTFNSEVMGTNNARTPENNARSMGLIKRTIANYRPTRIDPPVADPLVDIITIEMNREENLNIPFQISNTGESPLTWEVDFLPPGGLKTRSKLLPNMERMDPVAEPAEMKNTYNSSGIGETHKNKGATAQILYSTSFEQNQGFSLGAYQGVNEWRVTSGSGDMNITGTNAFSGAQHLRLNHTSASNTQFVSTPFFGYQMLGEYEITVRFSVSNISFETYDMYVRDSRTGAFTAGAVIDNGSIFFAELDEENEVTFFGGIFPIEVDTYYQLRIVMDPDEKVIRYYMNGQLMATNGYVGGTAPGVIQFLHRNQLSGSYFDIDNVEVIKVSSPYPWLSIDNVSGVALEGGTDATQLQFSTVGVAAGQYRTNMTVRTNDPLRPNIVVPITLNVANQVSAEEEDQPEAISLEQNYPNPFNPATTINFSLDRSQPVQLEVYAIDGRKVATLIDGTRAQGSHTVQFDASDLSSGIYLYRLITPTQILTRQMVLIK